VRDRRNHGRRAGVRASGRAGAVAAVGLRLWTRAAHHPVDAMSIFGAVAASLIVIVNAVFLQSGSHPAPFFANPPSLPKAAEFRPDLVVMPTPKPAEVAPARPSAPSRTRQTASTRRNDPIAELIGASVGSSSRVTAVQRALAEFGYGQIKPSGVIDAPTNAAIEKFESEHKLPVTGRLSDRLLSELASMTGRPLE
jgi:hypothetical protein